MTLTVPRAGVSGGRAARTFVASPGSSGGDAVGRAVAQFGSAMQQVGEGIERDRLSREARQAQLDLTRDLNAARLEFEQQTDPDAIDTGWGARAKEIIDGRIHQADPRLQDDLRLSAQGLSDRHAFALGQRAIALRHSQREATWLRSREEVLQAGSAMDKPTRDHLAAEAYGQIDDMLAAGTLTPDQAERRKLELAADLDENTAIRAASEDPARFLSMLDAGEFDNLPAAQKERMRASATRAIDTANDRAAREREKFVQNELDRISSISDPARMTQADRDFLTSPEAQSHPYHAEAVAAVRLAEEVPGWRTLPPDRLRAMRDEERARQVTEDWQEDRLRLLDAQIASHEKGIVEDPVAHLAENGFPVPQLPDFDPADPAAFGQALAARQDLMDGAGNAGWNLPDRLLTEGERRAVRDLASVNSDPSDRLAFVASSVIGLGDKAPAFVRQVTGGDPVLEHVTRLMSDGAPRDTAFDVLAGARALQDKTVTVPPRADFVDGFRAQTDDVFADYPEYQAGLLETVRALYASGSDIPGGWSDGADLNSDLLEQSVQRALGFMDLPRGRGQVGGLVDVRGTMLPLPPGIRSQDVDRALAAVSDDLVRDVSEGDGDRQAGPPDLSRLTAAAIDGVPPDFGTMDDPLPLFGGRDTTLRDLFEDYEIEELWQDGQPQDVYYLRRQRGGRWVALPNAEGGVFSFSLRQLIEATR